MSEETINYLIYNTETDAIARADTEGLDEAMLTIE